MNFIVSECSSGCESGWTNYLEQSLQSANPSKKKSGFNVKKSGFCDERDKQKVDDEVEEEDLSMLSDASSGPPHEYMLPQGTKLNKNGGKRHRNKEQQRRHEELPSVLDDTASSPLINYSTNNFVHTNNQAAPMGFSTTHFEGGSKFQDHFGFLQSSSPSANQLQNNQWF